MRFLWATRGYAWGFRFLNSAGFLDPLPEYERAFSALNGSPAWRQMEGGVALRFPDPERRRDRSGRVIPHEFIVYGPDARKINSLDEGVSVVWPAAAAEFNRVWKAPTPPPLT